jgi:DNA repair protein RecO
MATPSDAKAIDGIVLRAFPSGEADLVLKILTPTEGKITAIAKHARRGGKRIGSNLEPFDCGRLELRTGRGPLPVVQSFYPISNFSRLRDNLDRIAAASLLCEISDLLSLEGAPAETDQFLTLTRGLDFLQKASGRGQILQVTFDAAAELLTTAGFLNRETLGSGTTKRFIHLLDQIERSLDRKLATREAIEQLIKDFKKERGPGSQASCPQSFADY